MLMLFGRLIETGEIQRVGKIVAREETGETGNFFAATQIKFVPII